jgi:hypothetical protein
MDRSNESRKGNLEKLPRDPYKSPSKKSRLSSHFLPLDIPHLQHEYCEDKEKQKNKNAKIDYHNDPLNEHGHNEDEKFGQNEDNEVG